MPAAAAYAQAASPKVDLLFVVDNSSSMQGEQASLRAQIPALIKKLTEDREHPVTDLHVGVFFSVIAGVPVDLVDGEALKNVAFEDSASRDRFYNAILNDPRMQEVVDPSTNPGTGQGNLIPSCVRIPAGETNPATAYPPRRLVELARQFGEQGFVQSICQDDLAPAVSAILDRLPR